jgi:radical SAM superfamily enzyme YgiQ (UPF0313 family)
MKSGRNYLNKIYLTADKSLLNDFHLKQDLSQFFYGSGDLFPSWIFSLLVHNPKIENGSVKFAPYPLRKIEAKILDLGYDVSTISFEQFPKLIQDAKILGIHTVNPLGLAFNTYLRNFLNEKYEKPKYFFNELIQNKYLKKAKENGLKIIIGGQGAWQFELNQNLLNELGIDCVIIGEAELVIDKIITRALNNQKLPKIVKVNGNQIPNLNQISEIKNPSISGCVEIGRGCPRHCKFCEVTQTKLRWYPLSKIKKELIINSKSNLKYSILHAEDVFLYGQNSVIPNKKKILDLIQLSKNYAKKVHFTHVSIASSLAIPDLIESVMDKILQNQDYLLVEVGIETGSVELLKKNMASKAKPFKPEQWNNMIYEALEKMHNNMIIPFCSIIFGLPYEKIEDKEKTLELVKGLSNFRCILFPVNFISMGIFKNKDSYSKDLEDLHEIDREICFRCVDHNLKWINKFKGLLYKNSKIKFLIDFLSKIWIFQYERNVSNYKKLLKYADN